MTHKTVFISYSWGSVKHSEWVLNFANNLISGGVNVILDQHDLSAGKELTRFMEKSVGADKILMVMTPNYKLKADKREGGVGFEYSLITQEYYNKQSDKTKIIPILRSGDKNTSPPTYMQTKIYHNMVDDKLYDTKLFELIKIVYDKPLLTKPTLGKVPDFDAPTLPDLDKKLADFNVKEKLDGEKFVLINSTNGVQLFLNEVQIIFQNIGHNVNHYKDNHNFYLITKSSSYSKKFLISSGNFTYFFQPIYSANNSAANAYIIMNFYVGPVGLEDMGIDYNGEKKVIYERKYLFQIDDQMTPIWINEKNKTDILKTNDVHSLMFREVINHEIDFRNNK